VQLRTNELLIRTLDSFEREFGPPSRRTAKIVAWDISPDYGVVVQIDYFPPGQSGALVWLPVWDDDGQPIPATAKKYPAHAGRHSNTYPSPGLGRGLPVLRLSVTSEQDLTETIHYVKARAIPDSCLM
jgi:hypothetical protein